MISSKNKVTRGVLEKVCEALDLEFPEDIKALLMSFQYESEQEFREKLVLVHAAYKENPESDIRACMEPPKSNVTLPLYGSSVSCGFTSPAEDFVEDRLSLDKHVVKNPEATFFVRAAGDSMTGAGIFDGDLLVIDRSIIPKHNHVVLAVLDAEFTVKRLIKEGGKVVLQPENPIFEPIKVREGQELVVWGVVSHVVHSLMT